MAHAEELRQLQSITTKVQPYTVEEVGSAPLAWLVQWVRPGMFLLLHTELGVVWGKGAVKEFVLSDSTLQSRLTTQPEILQMARLFDQNEETMLWAVAEGCWQARRVVDEKEGGSRFDYFDEPQILSGTAVEKISNGFAYMVDGEEGLRHAPPLDLSVADWNGRRLLRLDVRHYLVEEKGWLRVRFSRLWNLHKESAK